MSELEWEEPPVSPEGQITRMVLTLNLDAATWEALAGLLENETATEFALRWLNYGIGYEESQRGLF